MASADITAKGTRLNGVNSPDNYLRREAHLIDGGEHPGILAEDTHSLFRIPAGSALVGLEVVALADTESEGDATIQFKAKAGSADAEAINENAIDIADLAAGDVARIPVSGVKGYSPDDPIEIQLAVGTAALSALKLLVVAEFLPVKEFTTAG